ncbi:phage tail protein [Oenococcus oeni]|uniref:phage tail protein n=1 Tax=Oenococcus oeni TaxID=1247 RepID=UPI0008F92743|nr:phage tail protein [Oenococcus oeni]OIL58300.1 phage tail protein [Oenococcus oeni]
MTEITLWASPKDVFLQQKQAGLLQTGLNAYLVNTAYFTSVKAVNSIVLDDGSVSYYRNLLIESQVIDGSLAFVGQANTTYKLMHWYSIEDSTAVTDDNPTGITAKYDVSDIQTDGDGKATIAIDLTNGQWKIAVQEASYSCSPEDVLGDDFYG